MLQLAEAPELSQRAVYADIFGFAHNMSHSRIALDPTEDVNTTRYRLFSRAIRVIGGKQLPELQRHFQAEIENVLHKVVDSQSSSDGWVRVRLAPLMRKIATGTLGKYVFGESLTRNPEFESAMHGYYKDVVKSMGALKFCPSSLRTFVYNLVTRNGYSLHKLFKHMSPIVRSGGKIWSEEEPLKSMTLIYNMIHLSQDSTYWEPDVLMQAIVGIWFAASHQPWVNLHCIFLELCERPEYIGILREEIESSGDLDYKTLMELPILDSFAKESARLNPLDKMAIRRKALKPFTFTNNGPHVPAGGVVCTPAFEIMHDSSRYAKPFSFDGFRFTETKLSKGREGSTDMRGTKFTDPSKDFPIWGLGSKACPGRFHASLVMKLAISHIVRHYEFRLEQPEKRHRWFWETYMMPYESTTIQLRKRDPCR
ncbi:MAG: hypothetical protein M1822_007580 [Bathelium mastoideum]|nr:MAG: hypothetical protein M1822_007580 [Bathelium mastoideum]